MPASQAASGIAGPPTSVTPTLPRVPTTQVKEYPAEVGKKLSQVHNLPVCTLCGQPTQGHKKYKRKTFCPVKMMSTSKGLDSRVYGSYEHFTSVVDQLE